MPLTECRCHNMNFLSNIMSVLNVERMERMFKNFNIPSVTLVCRLELRRFLGQTVADANLRQVASLAQTLYKLQPSNKSAERNLDACEDLEFGADFNFEAPGRFLVDVALDSEDMMDYESTAPLAFQEGLYDHTSPTDHSVVDGAKFNLSWLRNACDKIVKNSISQLSRDELAMTICRVLDSEKPGEEVLLEVYPLLQVYKMRQLFN